MGASAISRVGFAGLADPVDQRVIVWFSCGAASAVAARLAVEKYPLRSEIVYCNTLKSEDDDNARFLRDISAWINKGITMIGSSKYKTVDEVFEGERFMSSPKGARCTVEMKKVPRNKFQRVNDVHIFGYTADEPKRFHRFQRGNPELNLEWILRDNFIRKADCFRILREAGIELPRMYARGFEHNNCIGCVKSSSPAYWQRIAKHYPEVFARRVQQSRDLGVQLIQVTRNKTKERIFLDDLDLTRRYKGGDGDQECGPFCLVESES